MTQTHNPYETLPPDKFWKTGVADRGSAHFHNIWSPRFSIGPSTRFATAGSCFAQHISRWLQQHGLVWLDSEPAPADLGRAALEDSGYGVFSFRTGNIYTAALLRQWVFWALGLSAPVDEILYEDGAYFDPFRPAIRQAGYPNEAELRQTLQHTLHCIKRTLIDTDLLIFTLGLTEGWQSMSGHHYPMCPGTLRGCFDPTRHRFVNHSVDSIVSDLHTTFDAIRSANPRIKFLLTVSPVPLTATASDMHVLVATSHSKSVLRAAASALQDSRDDVDYFPSYELISSFPIAGRFYDRNLRTVTQEGVDYVMSHFGAAIPAATLQGTASRAAPAGAPPAATANPDALDRFCEDILLQTWNPHDRPASRAPICLIGDSHMGKLSQSLKARGLDICGGMIMNGSAWFTGKFHLDKDELFVPLEDSSARRRWSQTLEYFAVDARVRDPSSIVLVNIGMQTHMSAPSLVDWFYKKHGHLHLNADEAMQFFLAVNVGTLAIIESVIARGYRVLAVTDPPTQAVDARMSGLLPAFQLYDEVATVVMRSRGCRVFNAREHFGRAGFADAYYSQTVSAAGERDWIHGSDAYYAELSAQLCSVLPVEPAAKAADCRQFALP